MFGGVWIGVVSVGMCEHVGVWKECVGVWKGCGTGACVLGVCVSVWWCVDRGCESMGMCGRGVYEHAVVWKECRDVC